jgi:hypothetical protein
MGLVPPGPPPADSVGIRWETALMAAEAVADSGLKSFERLLANPGRSAARSTAASIRSGVAASTASICASSVVASGSSWRATACAELEVPATRRLVRSASAFCVRNIRSSEGFARTFCSVWISDVDPVGAAKGSPNSRWTSSKASWAGTSVVNSSVPDSVPIPPSPTTNTPVSRRKASTIRPG